jgi:NADH dehydrogenase
MPVLVTGAETGLGMAAVRALRRGGGEVRAYLDAEVAGDEQAENLRRAGVKTALGEIDDEGRLEQACEQVHTVVHCWGGPLTGPDQELDGVAGVLSAALGAGVRRFVWPSHLGADAPDGVAYLEACAEAEGLLADATLETFVLRRSLTYGPGDELTRRLAGGGGTEVRADARHAPLALADLAAAIAQADRLERGRVRRDLSVVLELAGPETVEFAALVAALGGGGGAALPATTVALYSRDLVPGARTLGRDGTPLARGLAALI